MLTYNNQLSTSAAQKISLDLEPINIQPLDEKSYAVINYPVYPGNNKVNLKISKEEYDLFKSTGMIYFPAIRFDNANGEYIWLINYEEKGFLKPHTLVKKAGNYVALEYDANLNLDILRFTVNEETIHPDSFKYYNFLKIVYFIFQRIYRPFRR